jgi:hypothetical protein
MKVCYQVLMNQKAAEALSEQPERWRMALPETPSAGVGSGKISGDKSAAGDQCHPLYAEGRLPVAATAPRISRLDGRLLLFKQLVLQRHLDQGLRIKTIFC